jgi:hypothetical protein
MSSSDIVGALILIVVVVSLYYWAWCAFRAKSSRLYPVAWLFYVLMFFVFGVGPIPIIFLLYLDIGVDPYFDDSPTTRSLYFDKSRAKGSQRHD